MPWIVYEPIKVSFHITTLRTRETRVVIAFEPCSAVQLEVKSV
jgi:hypothetical protein